MDGAGAAVDGGGQPVDAAVGGHQHVGVERDLERPVNAGGGKKGWAQPQAMPTGWLSPHAWGGDPAAPRSGLTCSPGRCRAARPWWRAPAAAGCCRSARGPTAGGNRTIAGQGEQKEGGVTALPGAACPVLSPKWAQQGAPTKGGVGYGDSPPRGEKVTEGGGLSEVSPSRSRRWW